MANTSFVVFAENADGTMTAAPVSGQQTGAEAGVSGQQQPGAPEQPGAGVAMSNNMMMVPIIIVFVVMIALSIRSSSKEKKKREEMMNSIRKGTKIMTSGGILGEIAEVQKDQFLLKVANNVQIAISRSAVAQVIQPAADAADTKAEVTKR